MAYQKARHLLQVAMDIAAHHYGMTYADMDATFSEAPTATARRRNTQRLVEKLTDLLGDQVSFDTNDENRKVVKIRIDKLRDITGIRPDELSALDRAIQSLSATGGQMDAEHLKVLGTKIRLAMPPKTRSRLEVDTEALVSSGHVIARHGPSPKLEADVWDPVTEALLGLRQISFDYPGKDGLQRRTVHPFGIITGYRAYLIARVTTSPDANPTRWRIDRMQNVTILADNAERPEDFDLAAFARRGFGVYYREEEFGDVEWVFAADVADAATSFRFHPDQSVIINADGTVTVKFQAAGILEMAWALYPWGNKVTVIKPEALAELVAGHQRDDFPAVP